MAKILNEKNIKIELKKLNGRSIGLCHGVFDVVHFGHILHFRSAKKFSDILIVSITKSKFINKGPGKPLFDDFQRLEFLKSIKEIDYLYLCNSESSENALTTIKPNFYIKGPDYKNNKDDKTKKIYLEKKILKTFGGKIIYTEDEKFSSSKIINKKSYIFNNEVSEFLKNFQRKIGKDYIFKKIKEMKKLNVLLLGETIFDNYVFGDIIGKSGKEPHLVFNKKYEEFYCGGAFAVARHISSFVNKITFLSSYGQENYLNKYFKSQKPKNCKFINIKYDKKFNSIVKTRFMDLNSNYKMFGSYILPKDSSSNFKKQLKEKFLKNINKNNLTILCDYGHGFFENKFIKFFNSSKIFKSLNSQLNSSTLGQHSISKFKNSDLVIINENELRYEFKDSESKIELIGKKILIKKRIKMLIITRGKNGSILLTKNKNYYCPAFAIKSIDKVGAGDTILSIASLAAKINLHPLAILLISSICASHSIQTLGNKNVTNFDSLIRDLDYLLQF